MKQLYTQQTLHTQVLLADSKSELLAQIEPQTKHGWEWDEVVYTYRTDSSGTVFGAALVSVTAVTLPDSSRVKIYSKDCAS